MFVLCIVGSELSQINSTAKRTNFSYITWRRGWDFRTVKDMIYATVNSYGGDWVSALPYVEIGMRSSKHPLTKTSPYEAIFGIKPRLPQFIPENLQFENLSSEKFMIELEKRGVELRRGIEETNKERSEVQAENYFQLGEKVMMKCLPAGKVGISKPRFEGPVQIVRILNSKSYLVKFGEKFFRRHECDLKRYNAEVISVE